MILKILTKTWVLNNLQNKDFHKYQREIRILLVMTLRYDKSLKTVELFAIF